MSLVEWKQEFSVGVEAVDYEHKELIDLINEGYEKLQLKQSEFIVSDFLGEIFAKISSHFALEEKIMRNSNYDHYIEHKQDHERLLDEIRDIMDINEDQGCFNEQDLSQHLADWFISHFKTMDARLHSRLGPEHL